MVSLYGVFFFLACPSYLGLHDHVCDYLVRLLPPALVLTQMGGVYHGGINRDEENQGDTGLLSLVTLVDRVHLRHLRKLGNWAVAAIAHLGIMMEGTGLKGRDMDIHVAVSLFWGLL